MLVLRTVAVRPRARLQAPPAHPLNASLTPLLRLLPIVCSKTKRVVEEAVSPTLTLAMRAMYQNRAGRMLLREGAYKQLRRMSGALLKMKALRWLRCLRCAACAALHDLQRGSAVATASCSASTHPCVLRWCRAKGGVRR